MRGLTKYAAVEFGRHNIHINSTHPGFIDPVMLEESIPDVTPLGRKGTVEELAEVNLFLASDASSYLNGAEVAVDGGRVSSRWLLTGHVGKYGCASLRARVFSHQPCELGK